ncbi:endonuclease/exonuclease/phosphatase family protein [Rubritalea tangerina]|uniref:Endonuclease/exonuclease/phosphatase family protein n=2 Tax=Rubritalea tangerina TaxID=430798 RepID=A0ABW4Z992_9BACT
MRKQWICRAVVVVGVVLGGMGAEFVGAAENDRLRVLVWNVWRGTNKVDQGPEKALALIKESKADVCLLQESYDIEGERPQFGPWAAEQLGWNVWQGKSPHLCVMSPYTMDQTFFHKAWHAIGAELTDPKGRKLHAFSIWIDYRSGAGAYLRAHPSASDQEVLDGESERSGRVAQAAGILKYLEAQSLLGLKTPLLVGGDWNCPSHLDWTEATAKAFPYRRALKLPVSWSMLEAGFVDSFRAVYPDPVKQPGDTWSPLFREKDGEVLPLNRIDRLYYKSNREVPMLRAVSAKVYPEVLEDNAIPVEDRAFPSDHAALLIEYEWVGGE